MTAQPRGSEAANRPVVFLTGATSGLGEALARLYASQGATLGLFARRERELVRLATQLAKSP